MVAKACATTLVNADLSSVVPYYLLHMMNNWIWFALGMALSFFGLQERIAVKRCAICLVVCFCALGTTLFIANTAEAASLALLTTLGLRSFYSISGARFLHGSQNRFFGFVTQYTMAIWLMHQILAMKLLSRAWKLGFIVYPSRYLSEKLP